MSYGVMSYCSQHSMVSRGVTLPLPYHVTDVLKPCRGEHVNFYSRRGSTLFITKSVAAWSNSMTRELAEPLPA